MILLAGLLAGAFGAAIISEYVQSARFGNAANVLIGGIGGALASLIATSLFTPPPSLWAFLLILISGAGSGGGLRLALARALDLRANRRQSRNR